MRYRGPGWRTSALPVLLILAAAGAVLVLAVRLGTWSRCWRDAITEGREGPGLYALWRVLHGHPLYEHPLAEPYSLTLYNFGFYHVYARLHALLGLGDEGLLLWPRLVTLLGAAFGAYVFVRLAARVARPSSKLEWAALGALSFVVWFGTQFISWWAFAVRPDVWAAALALLGLDLVLSALEEGSLARWVVASLVFACAWSFKQSTVWTLAGSFAAVVVLERSPRRALALGLPFAAVVGLALTLGGPEYRENLLHAPVIGRMGLPLLGDVLLRAIPGNAWTFFFGWLALAWESKATAGAAWRRLGRAERALAVVALTACFFGGLACAREGSNKNHLLEGHVVSALAAWCAWRRVSASAPAWLLGGGALAALPLAALPGLQLSALLGLVEAGRFGRITFCSEDDARSFATVRAVVEALPHPVYAEDEVFGQPWHTTSNRYPTLVLDGTWYAIARREGLLPADFPREALERRGIKSALLPVASPLVRAFEARGARCEALAAAPIGVNYSACRFAR